MESLHADIDIDVPTTIERKRYGTRASTINQETNNLSPHPCGIYLPCEHITKDEVTGLAAITYNESYQFFKVDLLSNSVYDKFSSKTELLEALHAPVDWEKFDDVAFVEKLPQLKNQAPLVTSMHIRSIHDLADALALIRPGKAYLQEPYLNGEKERARAELYTKPATGANYFKKSHAYAYACMLICVVNHERHDSLCG